MPSRAVVDDFLAQPNIAVVGVSRDPKGFPNAVVRRLREDGHTVTCVNVNTTPSDTLEGGPAYAHLADIPGRVDGVLVMVSATSSAAVVQEAIDRGVTRIWLHRGAGAGAVSPQAVAACKDAGVAVVDGACPLMFSGQVKGVHKLHRAFVKRRFTA